MKSWEKLRIQKIVKREFSKDAEELSLKFAKKFEGKSRKLLGKWQSTSGEPRKIQWTKTKINWFSEKSTRESDKLYIILETWGYLLLKTARFNFFEQVTMLLWENFGGMVFCKTVVQVWFFALKIKSFTKESISSGKQEEKKAVLQAHQMDKHCIFNFWKRKIIVLVVV